MGSMAVTKSGSPSSTTAASWPACHREPGPDITSWGYNWFIWFNMMEIRKTPGMLSSWSTWVTNHEIVTFIVTIQSYPTESTDNRPTLHFSHFSQHLENSTINLHQTCSMVWLIVLIRTKNEGPMALHVDPSQTQLFCFISPISSGHHTVSSFFLG